MQVLDDGFHPAPRVITDAERAAAAAAGGHFDDAGSPAGAVLRRLGGVLEHREAVDVSRIEGNERRKVADDPVDNDERVIAAGQRGRTAHAHRLEHRRRAGIGNRNAGGLSGEGIQAPGGRALVQLLPGNGMRAGRRENGRVLLCPQAQWQQQEKQGKEMFHSLISNQLSTLSRVRKLKLSHIAPLVRTALKKMLFPAMGRASRGMRSSAT